jgi:hypothetical protein
VMVESVRFNAKGLPDVVLWSQVDRFGNESARTRMTKQDMLNATTQK